MASQGVEVKLLTLRKYPLSLISSNLVLLNSCLRQPPSDLDSRADGPAWLGVWEAGRGGLMLH